MPFCRSLCPCTFSKHLQFSYKFSQGGKNGNKSTKIKSWMKCFVIFRLDCMSSSLSHSVNQSQRIIVWFAMIPPLQTFSQLFWIHHQNKGPREMYNINQFESKLVCIVISEHEFTQGFQSCLEWKSAKKHILLPWSKLVLISNRKKLRSINSILRKLGPHLSLLRACALINIRCHPDWDNCNRSTSFAINMKIFWKRDCSFKINMHA